jgi:hypothetical protein
MELGGRTAMLIGMWLLESSVYESFRLLGMRWFETDVSGLICPVFEG